MGDNEVTVCIFPTHLLDCSLVVAVFLYPEPQLLLGQTLSHHCSSCQLQGRQHRFALMGWRWQQLLAIGVSNASPSLADAFNPPHKSVNSPFVKLCQLSLLCVLQGS